MCNTILCAKILKIPMNTKLFISFIGALRPPKTKQCPFWHFKWGPPINKRGCNTSNHKNQVSANTAKLGVEALIWKTQGAQLWRTLRAWSRTHHRDLCTQIRHSRPSTFTWILHVAFFQSPSITPSEQVSVQTLSNCNHLINLGPEQKVWTYKKPENNLLRPESMAIWIP